MRGLEAQGHVRLSVDEEVWARFGRYGVDSSPAEYARLSKTAEDALRERLLTLMAQGREVVVDFSFWQRATSDQYKRLVEATGRTWQLMYLKADPALLRERLDYGAQRFDANAAFAIGEDILATYLAGFEEPEGENEELIRQDRDTSATGSPGLFGGSFSGLRLQSAPRLRPMSPRRSPPTS